MKETDAQSNKPSDAVMSMTDKPVSPESNRASLSLPELMVWSQLIPFVYIFFYLIAPSSATTDQVALGVITGGVSGTMGVIASAKAFRRLNAQQQVTLLAKAKWATFFLVVVVLIPFLCAAVFFYVDIGQIHFGNPLFRS